jgi:hypothetical protein
MEAIVQPSIMPHTMAMIVTNGTVYCLRRRSDVAFDECLACSALTDFDSEEIRCRYSPSPPPWRRLWNAVRLPRRSA